MRALKYLFLTSASILLTISVFAAAAPGGGGGGPCRVTYTPGASFLTILPPNCEYESDRPHSIDPDIPEGLKIRHSTFLATTVGPGGTLGGYLEEFDSVLTVSFADAVVSVPTRVTVSTEPFEDAQQFVSFATSMDQMEGTVSGGPVFDYFSIRAGTELVGESPGQTTISVDAESKTAVVDSVFSIAYEIEYQGAADGPLAGKSGVFRGTATMEAFGKK